MILVYFTVGSTSSGSAFVIAPILGTKTIFESISLWRQLLPLYFLIRFTNPDPPYFCKVGKVSYYDISLLYNRIHLKWISLCYCAKSWRQNYLRVDLTLKMTPPPYISWSGSSIQIHYTFVLFKDVTLTWINYLETWLRSDNTSCYYKGSTEKVLQIMMQLELI